MWTLQRKGEKIDYKFKKTHACQNTVAMERANCFDQNMFYQIVVRQILGKGTNFGGVFFNIKIKLFTPMPLLYGASWLPTWYLVSFSSPSDNDRFHYFPAIALKP